MHDVVGHRHQGRAVRHEQDGPSRVPQCPHGVEDHLLTGRALRDAGRTVLLVAHRPSLVAVADDVVQVRSDAGVLA